MRLQQHSRLLKSAHPVQAMCCDYGFRSGFGRLYQGGDGEIPKNLFVLVHLTLMCCQPCCRHPVTQRWAQGWENYKKEFRQLRRSFRMDEYSTISQLNPPRNPAARVC